MHSTTMRESAVTKVFQGTLRGTVGTDFNGDQFYKFLGIPYAKPPIGELRFKDPVPAEPWTGVRDATQEGNACYSRNDFTREIEGSEDCLFLNVFTKTLPHEDDKLKPVMVWIHGGAFITGSSTTKIYGPEFLITEDIVLVCLNYRIGILGFLKLEDPSFNIPGNAGLKDQNLALKWVKNNIGSFNGDSNNITIFGESAGAASVHYQVLSPLSSGLFHKAIIQSGCALNDWALSDNDPLTFLKRVGVQVDNDKEAFEMLRNLPVDQLYQYQEANLAQANFTSGKKLIGPEVETAGRKPAFLPKHPFEIISSGTYNKIPIIFGYNNNEGILLELFVKLYPKLSKNTFRMEDAIPAFLQIDPESEKAKNIARKLKNMYFRDGNTDQGFYKLLTDAWFFTGIMASIKNHLETNPYPIYMYRLSAETALNMFKQAIGAKDIPGVCHGDDLGYLFKTIFTPPISPGSLEDISWRRVVKLWTNFAKFGMPSGGESELDVIWKPVMKNQTNFLDIGEELTPGVNPESERLALWREIFSQSPFANKYL